MTIDLHGSVGASSTPSQDWKSLPWDKIRQRVRRLQMRIAKAIKEKRYGKAKALQWILTHSHSAKLLAVQRVTTNQGARTPGVDKKVWRTDGRIELHEVSVETRRQQHAALREREAAATAICQDRGWSYSVHTDRSLLPRRQRAWASWNYHLDAHAHGACSVTYHMNRLQALGSEREFCVTLNRTAVIDPEQVIDTFHYDHPIFTPAGVSAQQRHHEISGRNRTHYCGAYWGWGFHEDGVRSALRVVAELGSKSVPRLSR